MGSFSFMCKECGLPILSDCHKGEKVNLFLLEDGKVIDSMSGEYDCYGGVFENGNTNSIIWSMEWCDIIDLHFNKNIGDGIAAIHTDCYRGINPTTRSDDDPNQGSGYEDEEIY